MNVASRELSQELYELSGWKDVRDWWWGEHVKGGTIRYRLHQNANQDKCGRDDVPAYDLGYLLSMLPITVDLDDGADRRLTLQTLFSGGWDASYDNIDEVQDSRLDSFADAPEDAAVMLAIELFKQGVLTRDGDE